MKANLCPILPMAANLSCLTGSSSLEEGPKFLRPAYP